VPRDRFMDLLRAGSMFMVVLMHWLSVVPVWRDGRVDERNVTALLPFLWPLSWIGDVMPVFFFVGGYANWVSWRNACARGEHRADFIGHRYRRLLVPALVFMALWMLFELVLRAGNLGGGGALRLVSLGNTVPFGPLWFLGVYLVVVGLSPWTIALHRRWGLRVVGVMTLGVVATDCAANLWGRPEPLLLNVILVWSIPHQLGYLYAEGRLQRLSRPVLAALALAALGGLAALTSLPWYPRSLVVPRYQVFGLDAPTLVLVFAGTWQIATALLLRQPLQRLLRQARIWRVVQRANEVAIAVFLWQMTAYLAAALLLQETGMVFAEQPGTAWWLGRPPLLALSAVLLAPVVLAVRRLESAMRHHARVRTGMHPAA